MAGFIDKTIGRFIDEPIKEVDKRYVPDNSDLKELERQRQEREAKEREERKKARKEQLNHIKDVTLNKKGGSSRATSSNGDGSAPEKETLDIDKFETFEDPMDDMKSVSLYRDDNNEDEDAVNDDSVTKDDVSVDSEKETETGDDTGDNDFEAGLGEDSDSTEEDSDDNDNEDSKKFATDLIDADDFDNDLDEDDDDIEEQILHSAHTNEEEENMTEDNVIELPDGNTIAIPVKSENGYDDKEVDSFIEEVKESLAHGDFVVSGDSNDDREDLTNIYQEEVNRLTEENNKFRSMLSEEFSSWEQELRGNLHYQPLSIRKALREKKRENNKK